MYHLERTIKSVALILKLTGGMIPLIVPMFYEFRDEPFVKQGFGLLDLEVSPHSHC
jgi:hypothetical protein